MLDLKHEVEHSLNLKEALEYQLQQENPDLSKEETLQNYRAAKASYEICKKALDAKQLLLDLSLLKEKSSYTTQLRKEALAALVLKNILHKEVKHTSETHFNNVNKYINEKYRERDNLDKNSEEYDELDDKAFVDTMALSAKASISKVQRELTSEKVRDYLEKLTKSKTIEKMEKYLDPTMLDSFEYEESFCEKVVETIMKEEASVLNVKEMQVETNIQKKQEDILLKM